jgi:hypothetical protein
MSEQAEHAEQTGAGSRAVLLVVAWLWVLIPFTYGLIQLIRSVTQLFN